MDQAQALRHLARKQSADSGAKPLRTLAVTSGKGGVGKTNVSVNLAVCFAKMGHNVLIIDADLGLANVDVVLGLNPQYTIRDVLSGAKSLEEVVLEGPAGVQILPASSGVSEMSNLTREEKMTLLQVFDTFEMKADIVIIDTAAGISDTVLYFNTAAQQRIVVATGEPTSLTDAYALIKVLFQNHQQREFSLLVNNVENEAEAKGVYRKLWAAADHFLGGVSIDYLGWLPTDKCVHQAVMRQKPVMELFPGSAVGKAFVKLARVIDANPASGGDGNIKFFWRRLVAMA